MKFARSSRRQRNVLYASSLKQRESEINSNSAQERVLHLSRSNSSINATVTFVNSISLFGGGGLVYSAPILARENRRFAQCFILARKKNGNEVSL